MMVPLRFAFLLAAAGSLTSCKDGCASGRRAAAGLAGFEGEIEEATTVPGRSSPERILYKVAGPNARLENPDRVVIWNSEAQRVYRIDPAKKVYTQKPWDPAPASKPDGGTSPRGWTETGTDVIAGHRCRVIETQPHPPSKSHQEACLADDIQTPGFGASSVTGLVGLRMRLVSYDEGGAEKSRTEVTRVTPRSIPSGDFTVPAGYTEVPGL